MRRIIRLQRVDEERVGNFGRKTRREEREKLGNLDTNGKRILKFVLKKGARS